MTLKLSNGDHRRIDSYNLENYSIVPTWWHTYSKPMMGSNDNEQVRSTPMRILRLSIRRTAYLSSSPFTSPLHHTSNPIYDISTHKLWVKRTANRVDLITARVHQWPEKKKMKVKKKKKKDKKINKGKNGRKEKLLFSLYLCICLCLPRETLLCKRTRPMAAYRLLLFLALSFLSIHNYLPDHAYALVSSFVFVFCFFFFFSFFHLRSKKNKHEILTFLNPSIWKDHGKGIDS